MSIITSTEYKTLYSVSGSADDSRIELLITIVNNFISNYCGITIDEASAEAGLKLPAAQMINHQLSKPTDKISETIGSYSYSVSGKYPAYILNALNPYRRLEYY